MTPAQFKALKTGDLVRGRFSGFAYVVTENHGDRVTAVRTQDLSNPAEWDLVDRDGRVIGDADEQPAQGEAVVRATVIKRGAHRTWMSGRLGELPDGTYSLYTAPPAPAVPDDWLRDAIEALKFARDHWNGAVRQRFDAIIAAAPEVKP